MAFKLNPSRSETNVPGIGSVLLAQLETGKILKNVSGKPENAGFSKWKFGDHPKGNPGAIFRGIPRSIFCESPG